MLYVTVILYFYIANHYNIIDKPNHRSSHKDITIRGGGIVFPISVMIWYLFFNPEYPLVVLGLLLITSISFIDDLKNISRSLRLLFHLVAVSLALWSLQVFELNWIVIVLYYIVFVGIINAYNFMDGINGITGLYSLVLFATLMWINQYQAMFIDINLLIMLAEGVLVFLFFNFRKKAKCFAGDVGSVSLAFIIVFLLFKLIMHTNQFYYILLLGIYGIDAVFTIMLRLSRGENIFKAHRLHLYQLLVNEKKLNHLLVSTIYGTIQLLFNVLIIYLIKVNQPLMVSIAFALLIIFYLIVRFNLFNQKTIP